MSKGPWLTRQADVAAGLTAVARLADNMKNNKEQLNTAMDALAIFAHVHKGVTQRRRQYLRPELPDDCRQLFSVTQLSKGYLFGDNVGHTMKEIMEGNSLTRKLRGGGLSQCFQARGTPRGRHPCQMRGAKGHPF